MSLWKMSFAGAVLIVAITVIRALVINKLPKRAFLALWWITLARLLIPISVPSALSIYSLLGKRLPHTEYVVSGGMLPALTPVDPPAVGHAPSLEAAPSVWTILWLTGAALCAVFFAVTYWRCRREFRTSLPAEHPSVRRWLDAHPLRRPLDIRQFGQISAPLTYGIFHPVILVPKSTNWEDTSTLAYILEHEYVHIQRFDAAAKLVLTAALCMHWFNPLVWVMYILANRDLELSCDEVVLHRFGEHTKSAYASILVSMEESKIIPLCNSFSKNAIEERIVAIMKTRKTSIFSLVAAVLLVAATTAAFATSALADHSELDNGVTFADTVTTCYTGEDGKTYYMLRDGRTLDETEYEKEFPAPDVEWWTYEEYKEWLETQKQELPKLIGGKAWANGKEFIWTQEMVDEAIAGYEEDLQRIKDGMMLSKTVDGRTDMMIGYDPKWSMTSQSYEVGVSLKNGEERHFGPYETAEELLAEMKPFCQEQVRLGNMDQQEFDRMIAQIEDKITHQQRWER